MQGAKIWLNIVQIYILCNMNHITQFMKYCIAAINSSPPSAEYVSVNWVSIGSDNGLSPIRRQAII